MSNRVMCKFFAHGACLKGEHCEYAHDWNAPTNNICTFYQRGACAYGSRCRYEHVKVSRTQSSGSSSSTGCLEPRVSGPPPIVSSGVKISGMAPITSVNSELSPSSKQFLPPSIAAWSQESSNPNTFEDGIGGELRSDRPADQIICSFAAAGNCPRGEKCPHVHGDLCPTCGKHCLHPFRPKEREDHSRACEKMQKHLEALKRSQEIECTVCLERVLSKPDAKERKFGILSECDHPFCIKCIREWRGSTPTSGMDVNSTLRACPICLKLSYFVIPSVIWYFSKEEKDEIVDNYKAKLKSIDCKHFDFGNGSCPFGISCFYWHTVKPRSLLWKKTLNQGMYREPRMGGGVGGGGSDSDSDDYDDEDDDVPSISKHMDAVHVLFDYLYRPPKDTREEVTVGEDFDFFLKLDKLEKRYSGDYDEEDFLTPWERSYMFSQLGYDMSDDEDDFLKPWERSSVYSQLGYDMSDDDY